MPPLRVRFPTEEEEERTRKFQVHNFYVGSVAQFLEHEYGRFRTELLSNLVATQRGLTQFQKIERRTRDRERVGSYLVLAWASELQFRLAGLSQREFLRYSNAWAPVHVYYAMYMSAQAWLAAMGEEKPPDNHTATLNSVANQLRQRSVFPLPWSVCCTGCPQLKENTYLGLPDGIEPGDDCEVLSRPSLDDFWPRYCKLLVTTRKRALERRFGRWKERNGRKNMYKQEKRAVAEKATPTTLFDFFWRLRVRSNYRDVKSFLMLAVTDDWQKEFFDGLDVLMETTCTILQNLVVAYAGPSTYQKLLTHFIDAQRVTAPEILEPFITRRRLLTG